MIERDDVTGWHASGKEGDDEDEDERHIIR